MLPVLLTGWHAVLPKCIPLAPSCQLALQAICQSYLTRSSTTSTAYSPPNLLGQPQAQAPFVPQWHHEAWACWQQYTSLSAAAQQQVLSQISIEVAHGSAVGFAVLAVNAT